MEVDTPALVRYPGTEPHLDPLKTKLITRNIGERDAYLITSPEFSLKKMITAGFGNVFELAKCFRNGEAVGGKHNPEFLMLEWYRVEADYTNLMDETEELLNFICEQIFSVNSFSYNGQTINLKRPWERASVRDLFLQHLDLDLDVCRNERDLLAGEAEKRGQKIKKEDSFDDIFFKMFLNKIEPNFPADHPLIVYDYPLPMAALACQSKSNPLYAERFEVYLGGMELANAFSELIDPVEQCRRFLREQKARASLGKDTDVLDEGLLKALEAGMPATAGIALGVDRLAMLFADAKIIDEVLPLPASQLFKEN